MGLNLLAKISTSCKRNVEGQNVTRRPKLKSLLLFPEGRVIGGEVDIRLFVEDLIPCLRK